MSIPQDSPWRGCAAYFPQPVDQAGMIVESRFMWICCDKILRWLSTYLKKPTTDGVKIEAQYLVEQVYHFNCRIGDSPLHDIVSRSNSGERDIVYRSSSGERDIAHHVFRWDLTPYEEIFQNGFQARRHEDTPDEVYFNLDHFVHQGGRPLDSRRPTTHAFVSTTLSSNWYPSRNRNDPEIVVYRYEIYAPGGICVAMTLGDRYLYPAQDEVCFVAGIAPQYIRSAQPFRLNYDARGYTRRVRVDNAIRVNINFNPQSHPPSLLIIQRPVFDYIAEDRRRRPLNIRICRYGAHPQREKRQVSTDSATTDWYAYNVANSESYIDAAFRSSRIYEAYLFMKNEYVLLNYAPGSTDDRILNGPLLICDGFPSLRDTTFGEYGIDCAFGSATKDEAFIFSGNLCAVINYAPGTTDDRINNGPMTIIAMFPFFKGTVFESGVDAAFESTKEPEAYLFKGNHYALINYGPNCHLIGLLPITEGFPFFRSTIFESGIDAALASHWYNEAYIFKGDSYARIEFAPASKDGYIIGGVKKILPNWPSLRSILPRNNRGLDVHDHSTEAGGRDQDEF